MRTRPRGVQKQLATVMDAIRTEFCDTSRDVADVTGMTVDVCSAYISELVRTGVLRRTGLIKRIPKSKCECCGLVTGGKGYQCFEFNQP